MNEAVGINWRDIAHRRKDRLEQAEAEAEVAFLRKAIADIMLMIDDPDVLNELEAVLSAVKGQR